MATGITRSVGLGREITQDEHDTNTNEWINRFKTVADLIAADWLKVGQTVSIDEYRSGVGGGAMFGAIVASGTGTADGGSYIDIAPSSVQFEQKFGPVASVEHFGAVGDGVTNDAAAIQAAEDSTVDIINLNGKTVFTDRATALTKNYFNGRLERETSRGTTSIVREDVPIKRFSNVRTGTKTFVTSWVDKDVLWLGTSIPHQGAGVDGYPELFGDYLNCAVQNLSWSSSRASYDVNSDAFDINTVMSLSMTEDDRVAGEALYGPTSAYNDSFDPVTLASQMTCDWRIKRLFDTTGFDVVFLDHNHNDRFKEIGTLTPLASDTFMVTGITTGATTTITVSDATGVSVGDAMTLSQSGVEGFEYFAGRVQSISTNDLVFNVDTSSLSGMFASGTLTRVDKNTLYGAFDFLVSFINYSANINGHNLPQIILSSAPSEYTNDTFDNEISSNLVALGAYSVARDMPLFNVMEYYDVDAQSHIKLFEDTVHPTTLASRKYLAAAWVAWATGGTSEPFNKQSVLLRGEGDLINQREALYSKWLEGFGTPSFIVGPEISALSDDFTTFPGSWTTFGTAPVQINAPWNAAEKALECVSTVATPQSYARQSFTGDESTIYSFSLWLDDVTGLTADATPKVVTIARIDSTGAYYVINLIITPSAVKLQFQYFKTPFTDLTTVATKSVNLAASTKHTVSFEVLKDGAGRSGVFLGYLDGALIASDYAVDDSGQTNPARIDFGPRSNNTGQTQTIYLSDLEIGRSDVIDYSQRFTGSFTAQSGEVVTVVNGVIVSAV